MALQIPGQFRQFYRAKKKFVKKKKNGDEDEFSAMKRLLTLFRFEISRFVEN